MLDVSAIQSISIDSSDFSGRKFIVVNNERIDTGDGALNGPVMPIPKTILGIFGTPATIYLNGVSSYDPVSGDVTTTAPSPVSTKIYAESYTLQDMAASPEIKSGDIRIYVPGVDLGYSSVALLILQVRDAGTIQELIE